MLKLDKVDIDTKLFDLFLFTVISWSTSENCLMVTGQVARESCCPKFLVMSPEKRNQVARRNKY